MTTTKTRRHDPNDAKVVFNLMRSHIRTEGGISELHMICGRSNLYAAAARIYRETQREYDNPSTLPVRAIDWWQHEKEQRAGGYRTMRTTYRDLRGPRPGAKLP